MTRGSFVIVGCLAFLLIVGCQSATPPPVVKQLPAPVYLDSLSIKPPPAAAVAVPEAHAAPTPSKPIVPADWIPPHGLSRRWTSIVIHHTASDIGSLRDIDQWHRGKGWDCCGYHFVIGNGTRSDDGQIEVGPRWRGQCVGAHTRLYGRSSSPEGNYYNEHGIGIVLVGNFDKTAPSARQIDALVRLVSYLSRTCDVPLNRVYVHGELKSTDCPGRHFSRAQLRQRLFNALAVADATPSPAGS